jgi:hypothetical protein
MLYRHVVETRPAEVLELGSGISTIVLGYAAKRVRTKGQPCRITSMEEDAFYHGDLSKLLPDDIRPCVDLILSPTEDRCIEGRIGRFYRDKPERPYTMLFIDGPRVPEANTDSRYFDGDILDAMAWTNGSLTAFVDGRYHVASAIRHLAPLARIECDRAHKFTRISMMPATLP